VSIRSSRPKLQKLIEDEVDDQDAVQRLIELSETINADLEKYDKLRKGDFQGASQVTVKPMYLSHTQGKATDELVPVL
jgi:ADP-ribosylation factor-binding protein GGA